jgi:MscS family membrane protein
MRSINLLKLTQLFMMILLAFLVVSCASELPGPLNLQPSEEGTQELAGSGEDDSAGVIATRLPQPTATPDPITRRVTDFVQSRGLGESTFLGLSADNWIDLAISALIVFLAFIIGTVLTRTLLRWVARRTTPDFGETLMRTIGPRLKWLIVVPALYLATIRLDFLRSELKILLGDIFFTLVLILITLIVWTLVDVGFEYYRERAVAEERGEQLVPLLLLLMRITRVALIIIAIYILFAHFGVNINAFLAAFGIGGLALSLAAQDTLADAISGFIILIDQPYRIGDRIEIQGEGTWGDVVEIGIRTTRIRTRDNRLVIVPNSIISKNQVINYTYPDPRYRIQSHISIAYGSDIEQVRRIITDTVRQVEGVLPDQPVDSLYIEMGESAMIFRVRWWLESYEDTRRMFDRVNTALQNAFNEKDIQTPYPIHTMNLMVDDQAAQNLSHAFRDQPAAA